MHIRPEAAGDHQAIEALLLEAFARPDEVDRPPPEAALVRQLREDGDALPRLCLVAYEDGEVIGHVMCSRGWISGVPAVGLGPIAVSAERQGSGVGGRLMEAVIGRADDLGEPAILLLGDPAYYSRFRFRPAAESGVEPPDAWGDYFQIRPLSAWRPTYRGTFAYAPAFTGL